jgi:hypothetical protein
MRACQRLIFCIRRPLPSEDRLARTREAPASLEKRAAALEMVLRRKADMPENFVGEFTEHADDAWITARRPEGGPRGLTPSIARACLLTARRQLESWVSISRSTIETLPCSRTRPPFTVLSGVKRVPTATPVVLSSRLWLGLSNVPRQGGRLYLRNARRMTHRRVPARPTS